VSAPTYSLLHRFESFYNFRVHNGFPMPSPHELVGRCGKGMFNVCTFRGNFHLFLSSLGKTRLSQAEQEFMGPYFQLARGNGSRKGIPVNTTAAQPVFLYEISQLSDKNATRASTLRKDLQDFLELDQPISPMIWFKPGRNQSSLPAKNAIKKLKIDICQSQYGKEVESRALISCYCFRTLTVLCRNQDIIRGVLMKQAVNASIWIAKYFVHGPMVHVSSKDYFVEDLMSAWERDPCVARRQANASQY
jgi:hypothetical protein